MKNELFTEIIPRYFHPLVVEAVHKEESNFSGRGGIYLIVSKKYKNKKSKQDIKKIKQLLFYRKSFLYSIIENIKPYERTNSVAYELALRTPEIISAFNKGEISARDIKEKYWLDRGECMDFEKNLFRIPEKNIHMSRDPFVFAGIRKGTVMKLSYSYPRVSVPKGHQTLMVDIRIDLTLADDEISSTMDALKLSLIEYKKRMDKVVQGSLEKDFLNSKGGYFKGLKKGDNNLMRFFKKIKYPNIRNSSIAERFFAYDMSKAGFSKQNIIEAIMMHRYSIVLVSVQEKTDFKLNLENIKIAEEAMTKLTRATLNTWINTVQDSIEQQLYKKYVSPVAKPKI